METLRGTEEQRDALTAAAGVVQVVGWPPFPAGVRLAAGIETGAEDPTLVEEKRVCTAQRKNGTRCAARALNGSLLCPMHDGRADASLAALTRRDKSREAKRRSEDVLGLRRLGTRALVAEALVEKAAEVRGAVHFLADLAADKKASTADRKAASLALIPWLNQALGNPTERVEHHVPSTPEELESLSTTQLEALVAQGRSEETAAEG